MRMSKQEKNGLVPKRRFPEFYSERNWEYEKLGTIFTERQDKGFEHLPLLSLTDKEGIIPQEETNRKNNSNSDKSKYLRVCPGDVAYNTMRMWEGRSAYVNIEGLVSPAYTVCKSSSNTNGLFFSYYFKTEQLIREFHRYSQGLVKDTLNLKYEAFSRIEAPFPLPEEQQKIADCLTSVDELITTQIQKLEALKAHKKGLMQQLFPTEGETVPRLRFPEFRDKGEWVIIPLDSLLTIGNGKDYKHLSNGDIPVYGSGGYMLSVDEYLYDGESVCIGRKGTINKPMFLSGKFWTVDTLFYTHSFKDCCPKFAYLIFLNINWFNHNEAGGVPSLSKSNINKIEVAVPSPDEQKKITECIFSIDDLITNQTKKMGVLKAHKIGLMQQLFPTIDEVNA